MSNLPGTPAAQVARDRPLFAILLKLIAMFLFSLMFAGVKWVGPTIPVGEIVFFRASIGMLMIVLATMLTGGPSLLATKRIGTHATRSLLGVTAMFCNFLAVTFIPLADATAIAFAAPMFTVIMAALILKEQVHIFRWSAVVIGFAGVLVIVSAEGRGPGDGNIIGAAFALSGAGLSATAMIVLRRMSAHENSEAIAFYFMLTSAVVGLLTIFLGWKMPSSTEFLILISMGVFGGIGQLLLSFSYRFGEASVLAPFDYSMMLWAASLGYFLFGDFPTAQVLVGASCVISAGLLILWREHVLGRKRALRAQSL
jgi:drug/metabolite transporter (DMT)-like permease